MALVFYDSLESPVECAMEISRKLSTPDAPRVRMGIHSGPISGVVDVSGRSNVAGEGINIAQRVMDCGDAGHILLSNRLAQDLSQFKHWRPHLHDLGECELKHGTRLGVVNFFTSEIGNSDRPSKLNHPTAAAPGVAATRRLPWYWVGAGAAVVLALVAAIFFLRLRTGRPPASSTASIPEKSIAVLPLENLSQDPENAYFADGVHEEILTRLAKISELKVISRTSAAKFRASPETLRAIAEKLGVANILEGSVQKSGNAVRVNVQLINARSDAHLWAETYDRSLTDVFQIESDIAKAIANKLEAKLTGLEEEAITTQPTQILKPINFISKEDTSGTSERATDSKRRSITLTKPSKKILLTDPLTQVWRMPMQFFRTIARPQIRRPTQKRKQPRSRRWRLTITWRKPTSHSPTLECGTDGAKKLSRSLSAAFSWIPTTPPGINGTQFTSRFSAGMRKPLRKWKRLESSIPFRLSSLPNWVVRTSTRNSTTGR
jgi:TolB-like protein